MSAREDEKQRGFRLLLFSSLLPSCYSAGSNQADTAHLMIEFNGVHGPSIYFSHTQQKERERNINLEPVQPNGGFGRSARWGIVSFKKIDRCNNDGQVSFSISSCLCTQISWIFHAFSPLVQVISELCSKDWNGQSFLFSFSWFSK